MSYVNNLNYIKYELSYELRKLYNIIHTIHSTVFHLTL